MIAVRLQEGNECGACAVFNTLAWYEDALKSRVTWSQVFRESGTRDWGTLPHSMLGALKHFANAKAWITCRGFRSSTNWMTERLDDNIAVLAVVLMETIPHWVSLVSDGEEIWVLDSLCPNPYPASELDYQWMGLQIRVEL